MKKHIRSALSLILLLGVLATNLVPVQAIVPRFTGVLNLTSTLNISSTGAALCKGEARIRDGYTFAGWWVSHFNSAEKLTYRYEEQPINEPITLYAVWSDGETPYCCSTPLRSCRSA